MSVGINYRRNISVGNSVAFLRFSGSAIRDIVGFGAQNQNDCQCQTNMTLKESEQYNNAKLRH
jgi:hypothetical protein